MTLRIPWLVETSHAFTSMVILSTSSATILRTYNQLSATKFFWPKWTETRRILTAAYVQLYCTIEGEVSLQDFQATTTIVMELLERSKTNHPAAIHLIRTWQKLSNLVRKSSLHTNPWSSLTFLVPSKTVDDQSYRDREQAPFDYTLPPEPGDRSAHWEEGQGVTFEYD